MLSPPCARCGTHGFLAGFSLLSSSPFARRSALHLTKWQESWCKILTTCRSPESSVRERCGRSQSGNAGRILNQELQ